MSDKNMAQEEISNYTAEYWESREDYVQVMEEMNECLPESDYGDIQEDSILESNLEHESECWNDFMDYEPSPYDGTYSEE